MAAIKFALACEILYTCGLSLTASTATGTVNATTRGDAFYGQMKPRRMDELEKEAPAA